MTAFNLASQVYLRLMTLYSNGIQDPHQYLQIVLSCVQLKNHVKRGAEWDLEFTRNGKKYTVYLLLTSQGDLFRLAEDLTMMVYRLHGGEDYRTPELCRAIQTRL